MQLGADQIDGKFEDLTMGFFNMFRATGTCIDKILPKVGKAAGGPAQGVGAVGNAGASQSSGSGGVAGLVSGCSFFGLSPAGFAAAPTLEASTAPKAQPRQNRAKPRAAAGARIKREAVSPPGGSGAPASAGFGGGGEPPSSGKKKLGRPSRNLPVTVDTEAQSLQAAQKDDQKMFGSGSQQHASFLKRMIKDLKTKIEGIDVPDEYKVLMVCQKRVEIWLEVLVAYNSFGSHSAQFQAMWDEQNHFAALDPVVPWDFPQWLCHARLESKGLGISTPSFFWKELSTESLSTAAVVDIPEAQTRMVSEKVALIASAESTLVKDLQTFFDSPDPSDYPVAPQVQGQIVSLHLVSHHAHLGYDVAPALMKALEEVRDQAKAVLHALTLYPGGRALIENAEKSRAKLSIVGSEVANIKGAASNISSSRFVLGFSEDQTEEHVTLLIKMNTLLFDLRQREDLAVPKETVKKACFAAVEQASRQCVDDLMACYKVVLEQVLASSPDTSSDDVVGYEYVHTVMANMKNATDLFGKDWGWGPESRVSEFMAVAVLADLVWDCPSFDASSMEPDAIAAAIGRLDAAKKVRPTILILWGQEFVDKMDTYLRSNFIVDFTEKAKQSVASSIHEHVKPFQDLVNNRVHHHKHHRHDRYVRDHPYRHHQRGKVVTAAVVAITITIASTSSS